MTRKQYVTADIYTVAYVAITIFLSITGEALMETFYNDTITLADYNNSIILTGDNLDNPITITDEMLPSESNLMQIFETKSNNQREFMDLENSYRNFSNRNIDGTNSTNSNSNPISANKPKELPSASPASISSSSTSPLLSASSSTKTLVHSEIKMKFTSSHHHDHHFGPFFEEPSNATTGALSIGFHLGTDAVLNCRVGMLKDKTVMWVRRVAEKFSLLTVGNITYSGDQRIHIKFQYPNNWRLYIKPIQLDDAGLYMCQVSTHPPKVFATNLTVLPPAVRVIDEQEHEVSDRYYKIGSAINLTCQVAISYLKNETIEPNSIPRYPGISYKQNSIDIPTNKLKSMGIDEEIFYKKIVWRKDGEAITKGVHFNKSSTSGWLNSLLTISSAERHHSGIYSCSVLNKTSAIVDVQILNGETPAAVQHSSGYIKKQYIFLINYLGLIYSLIWLYISC